MIIKNRITERTTLNFDPDFDASDVVFDGFIVGFVQYDSEVGNWIVWYINKRGYCVCMRFITFFDVKSYIATTAEAMLHDNLRLYEATEDGSLLSY